MPDRPDDIDRRLADRLRAYEDALPADHAPEAAAAHRARRGWPTLVAGGLGAVAAGALLAFAVGSLPNARFGQAPPTPSTPLSPSPSPSPSPSSTPELATASSSASPSHRPSAPPTTTPRPTPSPVPPIEEALRIDVGARTALVSAIEPLGDGRFIAAVNTSEWESISAVGPHGMDGSLYVGTSDGGWEQLETGDTFRAIKMTELFVTSAELLVAFGELDEYEEGTVSVGFTSTDGRSWTRIADVPWHAEGFVRVASGPLGYVAVTTRHGASGSSRIIAYRSTDAVSWSVMYESPDDASYSHHDIGSGPEGFVITGYRLDESIGKGRAITIASGDGAEWFMSSDESSLQPDHYLTAIVPHGGDWVAGAFAGDDGVVPVYWSSNGLDWERVATIHDPEQREYFGYAAHLAVAGDRLFLSAAFMAEGTESRPAGVWTSTDARTWSAVTVGAMAEVRDAINLGAEVLFAGRVNEVADETLWAADGDAVVWRTADTWFR